MSSTASARGPMLWGRALLLAGVALLAGTLAHVGAHGVVPGPAVMAALLLVGSALCAPLLRVEASRTRVVLLVVLGQAGVHVVLTALGGHHGEEPSTGHGPEWLEHLTSDLSGPHALMAMAHAVAAGVVGLWLAAGERALWSLARHAGRVLRLRPPALPVVACRPRVVPVGRAGSVPRRPSLVFDQPRRGPPVGCWAGHRPVHL